MKDIELAALSRHPSLIAAAHRVRALTARASAEGSLPAPELMLEIWRIPFSRPYALDQSDMMMLSVRQQFPAPGSLDLMAEATALEAQAEAARVAAEARSLLREVDRTFADYVEATMLHGAHLAHRQLLDQMVAVSRARYTTGAPLADVAKAELERSQLDVNIAHEDGRLEEARAKLNGLLVRPASAPLGPPQIHEPETVSLSAEQAITQAITKSPEITAADLMEKSARASIRAADREAIVPSFTVGLDYFHPTAGQPAGYGASLSVSLPWIWGAASNRARSAEHRALAEHASAENAQLRVRTEVTMALAQVRAAERQYVLLRDVARPAARRALEAAQTGYATSGTNVLMWLDAERSSLDVDIDLATARANLARALADLEWAAGEHLPRTPLPARNGALP